MITVAKDESLQIFFKKHMLQRLANNAIVPAEVQSSACYGLFDTWSLKRIFSIKQQN